MNQKIVKVSDCETTDEVLVQKVRSEDGDDSVLVSAWHDTEHGIWYQAENIEFENNSSLIARFISDFSEDSANDFAQGFEF